MAVFKVSFYLQRVVTTLIEAEDETDIDSFLEENPDIVQDYPEIIETDESSRDEDNELGDYDLTEVQGVTANWTITPGGELKENE